MNKTVLTPLLLAFAALPAFAAETPAKPAAVKPAAPAPTLVVGSKVTPDIFAKLDWIQGAAPAAWEPGAVYIFECWATWCGPCVANIPHVNELHQKYGAKGLHVYGIDVWEDGREKVAEFVKKKGAGMSYPVAYTGKGSVFENEWLKPAGVRGIPHAFVVKDGEIILLAHPAELSEGVIEGFLGGKEGRGKALAALAADRAKKSAFAAKYVATERALNARDIDAAEKTFAEMTAVNAADDRIPAFAIRIAMLRGDWAKAGAQLDAMPDSMYRTMNLQSVFRTVAASPDTDKTFAAKTAAAFAPILEKVDDPVSWNDMTKIRWRLDDKAGALAAANKALAASKQERYVKIGFRPEPYAKIVASLEAGTLPDDATVIAWNREAYQAKKAVKQ